MSEDNKPTNPIPTPDNNPTPPPVTPQGTNGGQAGSEEVIQFTPSQLKARLERDAEAEMRRFLGDLGLESRDALKALLTEHKQRKEAEMSEVEKLQAKLAEVEAKREQAAQELDSMRLQRIADNRDGQIKELAKVAGAIDTDDILLALHKDATALAALVDKDGTPDTKAIEKAIDTVKAAKPHLFSAQVPGVPSSKGGKPIAPDKAKLDAATKDYLKRLRG
jgi:chemotaxis protein histidine kinase CheA